MKKYNILLFLIIVVTSYRKNSVMQTQVMDDDFFVPGAAEVPDTINLYTDSISDLSFLSVLLKTYSNVTLKLQG